MLSPRSIYLSPILSVLLLSVLLGLTLGGCGKPKPPPEKPPTKAEQQAKAHQEIPSSVSGKGWQLHWLTRDPKKDDGDSKPVLVADADWGEITNPDNPTMELHIVTAHIYRNGAATCIVTAPIVRANQRDRTLFATGGVTLTSLTDPPDTVITSDTMIWDTHTSILKAIGHAHARTQVGGKPGTMSGDVLIYDNKTQEVRYPNE